MKWPTFIFGLVGLIFMALQILSANYFRHLGTDYILLSGLVGVLVSAELIIIGLGRGK